MVLSFGTGKEEDVSTLIAKKNYARAIEVIKNQLKNQRPDPRLRLQLGDVLAMAGKTREAVAILTPLADEFAREGFAAKAISVFKKIQKIDPGFRGVDAKLASLIQAKQQQATVPMPLVPGGGLELGMEEIGFEPFGGSISVPARDELPSPSPAMPEPAPEIDLFPAMAPAPRAPQPVPAAPHDASPAPVEDEDLFAYGLEPDPGPEFSLEQREPEPELLMVEAPGAEPVGAEPAFTLDAEPAPEIFLSADAVTAVPDAVAAPPEEMSESLFADELLSLVEGAFKDVPHEEGGAAPATGNEPGGGSGNQIVVSPLFKDFSVDELVAVIQGLNLLTYQAGEIIIMEGDPGQSLYMLTSGTVRALRRNAAGRQATVGELAEGAFFGEMSILTGKVRTATVVAATYCELLELDRATLDGIVGTHPRVLDILKEFAAERQKR